MWPITSRIAGLVTPNAVLSPAAGPALWTPASLVFPGVWYDAKDGSTITEEGGNAILQWDDKSGNGRHMTGSSGNSLRWNDVDTITSASGDAGLTSSTTWEPSDIVQDGVKGIFAAVVAYTSGVIWTQYTNSYGGAGGRLGFEGSDRVDWPNDNTGNGSLRSWSPALTTSFKVMSVRHSGSTLTARLNGTQVGTLSTGATVFNTPETAGNLYLFGNVALGNYSVCALKSVLWCGDNDSTSEQKIEGYLAWRFGLEGDLDAGHPYKSAAPTL